MVEVKDELQRIHELSHEVNDVNLYKRLQRQHYWPKMAKEAAELQSACLLYREALDKRDSLFIHSAKDWR